MDKTDRKIAAEILHSQGVLLVHAMHEIRLTAHKQRDGFTDKEFKFVMARHQALKEEMEKLSRLHHRMRFNGKH